MTTTSTKSQFLHRIGKWMPPDPQTHQDWVHSILTHVDSTPAKPLHPSILAFKDLIESSPRIYMLITSMLLQVPNKPPYNTNPTGSPQLRDYHHLLTVLNHVISTAPGWNDTSYRKGLVGLPINAILDWSMGTPSGFAAFLDPDINAAIKDILNAWGKYLQSPESVNVLDDSESGWFGEDGLNDLTAVANQPGTGYQFDEMFVCSPGKRFHGFRSWDDFFTRRFREGIRPVASPKNGNVIVNACESQPYAVARGIKERDMFWVKGQPYSVVDMLGHDEWASRFVGGTVYQAFLSALSYHRWHAPVSGTVVKAYVIDGTYYSEPLFEGIGDPNSKRKDIDMAGEVEGQGYITATATRGLIFIEADNPAIGLMVFIGVGMTEVSTCDITVKEGDHLEKGDQLGMFHFGGSSHCLLFRKEVNLTGFPDVRKEDNVPVNSYLATVV